MRLEELTHNAAVRGILPDELVAVVSVTWFGTDAVELTYKTAGGGVANQLLYRGDEAHLALAEKGLPWSFDGDGAPSYSLFPRAPMASCPCCGAGAYWG